MTPKNEEECKKSIFAIIEPSNPLAIKFNGSGDCEEEKEIQDNGMTPIQHMMQHPSRFILEQGLRFR
jgi:hypothetical protein